MTIRILDGGEVLDPTERPIGTKALRERVEALGQEAIASVGIVREAVASGIPPVQKVSAGSVADYLDRFGSRVAPELVRSTAQMGLRTAKVGTVLRPPRPELDYVELSSDPTYGVLDGFYVRVVVSLSLEETKRVKAIRLLRASNGRVEVARPAFSAMIDGRPSGGSRVRGDAIAAAAYRAAELGVGNKLTAFVSDDQSVGQRAVVAGSELAPIPAPHNTNRTIARGSLVEIDNADPSVLQNLTFFLNRRTVDPPPPPELPLTATSREGLSVLQGSGVAGPSTVVQKGNSDRFREVLRQPVSSANWRQVGGFVELYLYDPTVVYGRSYTYYVVAQDETGNESPRSRAVTINVARRVPPAPPEVLYSVVNGKPRFGVRVAGKFIDHVEVFRRGGIDPKSSRLLGSDDGIVSEAVSIRAGRFVHIGDLGVGVDGSITFIDVDVLPGQTAAYRFYSVDSFGVKCQRPFECEVSIPDVGRPIPLPLPTITAEQGIGDRRMNVTVSCDDPRVTSFVVKRREVGRRESSYREPSEPSYFNIGVTDAKRSRSRLGPSLGGERKAWSGVLQAVSGSAKMVDTAVNYDRIYQYIVEAIDVRGNSSSPAISRPVRIAVKPVADAPVGLDADVITEGRDPVGVRITWEGGTADFSPNELIGDQDVLAATAVRSVFQVERRRVGAAIWDAMPAVTGNYFIDPVAASSSPNFRPAYAVPLEEYEYRVIAMQSGGYLSNYTDPIRVLVSPEVPSVGRVWVRSTDTAVSPTHVVVSWNYSGDYVDGWEIERAVVNKLYARKITNVNSREAMTLQYSPLATVYRESSRAHGVATPVEVTDPAIFVGNRFFIDHDVSLANSYFYRVRAVDSKRFGPWTHAGISLTDTPHDRKLVSALSDDEKLRLATDPRPFNWSRR